MVHDFGQPVHVSGFDKKRATTDRIVSAVHANDDPRMGKAVILVVHHGIYFPGMQHNLLCSMQMCAGDDEYFVPLALDGVTSYLSQGSL